MLYQVKDSGVKICAHLIKVPTEIFSLDRSEGKKPQPHKRALLFVDNSGADVVLGMLPLARELLRRGTEVSLSLCCAGERYASE